MANTICYMCESKITKQQHVFKGYDETFCSTFCRSKLVRECDYTHECDLVKKQTQSNKPTTKPAQEEGNHIGFDLSVIDIHYASYNYRQDIIDEVYHKTPSPPQQTVKSYITDILCGITGLF